MLTACLPACRSLAGWLLSDHVTHAYQQVIHTAAMVQMQQHAYRMAWRLSSLPGSRAPPLQDMLPAVAANHTTEPPSQLAGAWLIGPGCLRLGGLGWP